MSGKTKHCERCGRKPAKRFEFRAHQGFLVARREIAVGGFFCRDCAIEAYCYAKGITLKGMWFSPGSLVFGTLGSVWDSVKLLDLPEEVKDAPWTWHNVACPRCRTKTKDVVGVAVCEQCHHRFAILSCAQCKCVNVMSLGNYLPDAVWVRCRRCSRVTEAATAARNAPYLLFARILAEIAGQVKWATDPETWALDPVDPDHWIAAFVEEYELHDNTIVWLQGQFARRFEDHLTPVIDATLRAGLAAQVALALSLAAMVATPSHRRRLHSFAVRLGLADPRSLEPTESEGFQSACDLLGVSTSANRTEVDRAYRQAANRLHPDRMVNHEEDEERARSLELMKQTNAAYELVCEWFDQHGDASSARPAAWNDEVAIAEVRRRSEVAKAARAQARRGSSFGQTQPQKPKPIVQRPAEADGDRCGPDGTDNEVSTGAGTTNPTTSAGDHSASTECELECECEVESDRDSADKDGRQAEDATVELEEVPDPRDAESHKQDAEWDSEPVPEAEGPADPTPVGDSNNRKRRLRSYALVAVATAAAIAFYLVTATYQTENGAAQNVDRQLASAGTGVFPQQRDADPLGLMERRLAPAIVTKVPLAMPEPAEAVQIHRLWRDKNYYGVINLCDSLPSTDELIYIKAWANAKLNRYKESYKDHLQLVQRDWKPAEQQNADLARVYFWMARAVIRDAHWHTGSPSAAQIARITSEERRYCIELVDWAVYLAPNKQELYEFRSNLRRVSGDSAGAEQDIVTVRKLSSVPAKDRKPDWLTHPRWWSNHDRSKTIWGTYLGQRDGQAAFRAKDGSIRKAFLSQLSPLDQVWLIEARLVE